MSFHELQLIAPLLRAVADEGYVEPTPIQRECIPYVLAGRDLLGCAQTGTGKTAAFALPMLQRFASSSPVRGKRPIRALVLTPTRELARQVAESFATYGRGLGLRTACVFGGVGQNPQVIELRRGIDVLVATPGRLLDLASQGEVDFGRLEVFVLDEADRMLDMGFLPDVRRLIGMLPRRRQTMLFSATMPDDIRALAVHILIEPVHVAVTPVASTAEKIEQSVFFVAKANKRALLEHVLQEPSMDRVLVFTRTKHGANRVVKDLTRAQIPALAIHGNKSQSARERALAQFKKGETRVLVATDIAARGLDVEGISHVVNFDLPEVAESYVHRIGRTARAGAGGTAFSFCDTDEQPLLRAIERLIRMRVQIIADHPHVEQRAQVIEPGRGAWGEAQGEGGNGRSHGGGDRRGRLRSPVVREVAQRQEPRRDTGQRSGMGRVAAVREAVADESLVGLAAQRMRRPIQEGPRRAR
ncbi:MAG: DEAD/DEAH box helicase [Polyangiaceae bacterium]|nr:DEAD/DEAH box helicase [Polyangiaceae bacterium]